jgi:hypothetical protein
MFRLHFRFHILVLLAEFGLLYWIHVLREEAKVVQFLEDFQLEGTIGLFNLDIPLAAVSASSNNAFIASSSLPTGTKQ